MEVMSSSSSNAKNNNCCRPKRGSTYLTIGQDLFSINEYVTSLYNASLHRYNSHSDGRPPPTVASLLPSAFMVYTDIQSLKGLITPVDYGSGVEYANGIFELFHASEEAKPPKRPQIGLQIGLWISSSCSQLAAGQLDHRIDELVHYMEIIPASRIFLRIGYEFDNPYFGYIHDPQAYQQAFQRIVNACRRSEHLRQTNKVLFVWHSWAASFLQEEQLLLFYPGDNYVDWVGISIFQQLYPWANNGETKDSFSGSMKHVETVLDFAKDHNKPVMVAESTPFGGIHNTSMKTPQEGKDFSLNTWKQWFEPMLNLIESHDISMWCYINCDWDSQPMWHNVGFGDTRISTNAQVMEDWLALVTERRRGNTTFLMAGSLENCDKTTASYSFSAVDLRIGVNYTLLLLILFVTLRISLFLKSKTLRRKNLAPSTAFYDERTKLLTL